MSAYTPAYRYLSASVTDPGLVRSENQDACLDRPDLGLWAVADGMGGHADGAFASGLLVETLGRLGHRDRLGGAVDAIRQSIVEVNQRLLDEAAVRGQDLIGSTIVALVAVGDHCAILWAGDSRAYRLRQGELMQLSVDHTHVQDLVARGLLSAEQAEHHPLSHVLERAVGGDDELEVDCRIEALKDGDRYLLCSDGLTKELPADEIARMLSQGTPHEVSRRLVASASEAGGRDNITVVVVDFRLG